MIVVVTGSRDWEDYDYIYCRLAELPAGSTIIHGGCRGADQLASKAARALGFKQEAMLADWKQFGKSAGPIRNRRMLAKHPDLVIAFCRNNSAGTMDCHDAAKDMGLATDLLQYHD